MKQANIPGKPAPANKKTRTIGAGLSYPSKNIDQKFLFMSNASSSRLTALRKVAPRPPSMMR